MSLEELHVAVRLREAPQPRGKKLQSSGTDRSILTGCELLCQ